ncbi:hypothetical protein SK803_28665 [Lentzea sp. BCCO 10_0856]|uniref:Uncharacterized protein n=1 Tax=Lentzea miocenica TaxID=3095431 RepID=A0ABU4T8F0_9PSEU|nr:hypothetical protein [Lentzea sp. BCCO 10_0856]MDX8034208.1 hypothetical protein [Lentzea sp. BCCO 10_0856]
MAPQADPRWPALAITSAISALAVGLTGQDADLDATAAWPWPLYRLAHVAVITAIATTLVTCTAPLPFVLRGCVGMAGLAALGAALLGGHLAWALPFAWFTVTFFAESWLLAPPESVVAAWVAATFGGVGTIVYMFFRSSLKI